MDAAPESEEIIMTYHQITTQDTYEQTPITLRISSADIFLAAPINQSTYRKTHYAVLSAGQCERIEREQTSGNPLYVCQSRSLEDRPESGILFFNLEN